MKKILVIAAAALAILLSAACTSTPSKELPKGEPSPELLKAAKNFEEITAADTNWTLHSIMVLQHGKVLYSNWLNGETPDKPHAMWSVSKTFTASAVGFAIAEGKLNLTDKVISFFPEDLPETVSDNLAKATVRDLLTMTIGMTSEPSRFGADKDTPWTKIFLAHHVEHTPGTYYIYNSMGSYMLSAIVQKVTGQKVNDYLESRLWGPLGIEKPQWDESPQGINCGGWGLNLKTDDMARFGQTLLDNGKYAGQQVIPADWVKEMTSFQVPCQCAGYRPEQIVEANLNERVPDGSQGYGYQMWRGRHNTSRADGAFGQLIIVMPDQDAVVVLTERFGDTPKILNTVWDVLLPALE